MRSSQGCFRLIQPFWSSTMALITAPRRESLLFPMASISFSNPTTTCSTGGVLLRCFPQDMLLPRPTSTGRVWIPCFHGRLCNICVAVQSHPSSRTLFSISQEANAIPRGCPFSRHFTLSVTRRSANISKRSSWSGEQPSTFPCLFRNAQYFDSQRKSQTSSLVAPFDGTACTQSPNVINSSIRQDHTSFPSYTVISGHPSHMLNAPFGMKSAG